MGATGEPWSRQGHEPRSLRVLSYLARPLRCVRMPGVLAAINWTLLLATSVTGLTAIVVSIVGYLASRLSATSAARQTEAETERLRVTHEEAHRQHRQGVYHDLLNVERKWVLLASDALDSGDFTILNDPDDPGPLLYVHLNGVVMFGTRLVAEAAVVYLHAFQAARVHMRHHNAEHALSSLDEVYDARRRLINAMRVDVAPDSAPIEVWWEDAELQPTE